MNVPPLRLAAIGLSLVLVAPGLSAADPAAPPSDDRLLNNVDSLQTPTETAPVPLDQLTAEVKTLWDRGSDASAPLNPEVVYTAEKNGCTVQGVYINGHLGAAGQDRIFFYYARPKNLAGRIPAYIELTGGSEPDRSLWLAQKYNCAVIDVEWRGLKNRFRSQWAGSDSSTMKGLSASLKDNRAYRLVTGVLRVLDYLQQQPDIDSHNLGCGGGSMGGYYTLLLCGVDDRLKFGLDELGAGHLEDSDSELGQFTLTPAGKKIWLQAFDPFTYAATTRARIFMNLSANDFFFWLGDALANYQALPGDKRLCITPNFDHNAGALGQVKNLAMGWLDYGFGRETTFPEIARVTAQGPACTVLAPTTTAVKSATLCWSPGENVAWPSRYWMQVPAVNLGSGWRALIPAPEAGLARWSFMTIEDANGCAVSSVPAFTPGLDPRAAAAPVWPNGTVWDEASGLSAWRVIGPNVHPGPATVFASIVAGGGFQLGPDRTPNGTFSIVTNSLILGGPLSVRGRGLVLALDGNGRPGKLVVSLVRNFGAVHQVEFSAPIDYAAAAGTYELPWAAFKNSAATDLFPFESLRLDGARPDGSPLTVRSIRYLK
jgi:hypothetical protein